MSDLRARLLAACKLQIVEKTGVPGVPGVSEAAKGTREAERYAWYAWYASNADNQNRDERQRYGLSFSNCRGWDAADWQAYFEERAAIRECDGGFSRDEAERLALQDTIKHWLCLNLHAHFRLNSHRGE
jgi:hypothetical protein